MAEAVHPLVERAAAGVLPKWAVARPERREHMARVSELMASWAETLQLDASERTRWRSTGFLHDALRDEAADALRARVPETLRSFPGPLLHGPAASERLRVDGVLDGELLRAVAFRTVGDPSFRTLGRALYAADFLEPGRSFLPEWRAELRSSMPHELDRVVLEIARARIGNLLDRDATVLTRRSNEPSSAVITVRAGFDVFPIS